jgi:hypothetical protein
MCGFSTIVRLCVVCAATLGSAGVTNAIAQCDPQWLPGEGISGVDAGVNAIIKWDPDGVGPLPERVVIGGGFTIAGDRFISRIAQWDGANWQPIGEGIGATVRALAIYRGQLFAGGDQGLVAWDGGSWQTVGGGTNGLVSALCVRNDELVVGGSFTTVGGQPAVRLARWNGASWNAFGAGATGGTSPNVACLLVLGNGDLVVGGRFTNMDGTAANCIARWDGASWFPFAGGMSATATLSRKVSSLAVYNGDLYAGGQFSTADGKAASHIARWDGATWHPVGNAFVSGAKDITSLVLFGTQMVAAGSFTTTAGDLTTGVAAWDGSIWTALGTGLSTGASALCVDGSTLVVGGSFTSAGGVDANRIASWNGTTWTRFGVARGFGGATPIVYSLTPYRDDLIGIGVFTSVDGISARAIARWNGQTWSELGGGLGEVATTFGLQRIGLSSVVLGDDLFVSGLFSTAGNVQANNIARWDGSAWHDLAGGMTRTDTVRPIVDDLTVYNGELVAVGGFTFAGGVPANLVARWDGASWHAFGSGIGGSSPFTDRVQAAITFQGKLIVGGSFTTAGGQPAANIAAWNGTDWETLGSGISGQINNTTVYGLCVYGDELIVAGSFTSAGGTPASGLARWNGVAWSTFGSGPARTPGSPFVYDSRSIDGYLYIVGGFSSVDGVSANNIARWNGTTWQGLASGLNNVAYSVSAFRGEVLAGGSFSAAGARVSAYLARWTETALPTIALQPQDHSGAVNASVTLTARAASGYQGTTYQWRRNSVDVADGPEGASPAGGTVSGASGALTDPTDGQAVTLTIAAAQYSDSGAYSVAFINSCGETVSAPAAVAVGTPCPGDLNYDAVVDDSDFVPFAAAYDLLDCANPTMPAGCPADLNADGFVDDSDFVEFATAYNALLCP